MRASVCASRGKAEGGTGKPPPKKTKKNNRGGRGGGAKSAQKHQTARQHHQRRPNPPPEGTEDRAPKEAQGDDPAKTGNTKPGTAAHRERGHQNKQTHTTKKKEKKRKKKSQQPSPKERGWGNRDHKDRDRDTQQKKKSAKNTPRQPSQGGLGTAETRAQHTRPQGTPEPETAEGKRGAHATTHVP